LWLRVFGWRIAGDMPVCDKMVLIGAPHTSNWDLPFMLAVAAVYGLDVTWMGKDSLFKKPVFGRLLRRLGGIPIDRSRPSGVVLQIVRMFKKSDRLALVVPPSGTRKKKEYWKSGFYWIAHTARVPIICSYLDYGRKEGGVRLSFVPTGDVQADMNRIRSCYQDIQGKHPHQTTRIRLKEEDTAPGEINPSIPVATPGDS